jgi:hypothetical protein
MAGALAVAKRGVQRPWGRPLDPGHEGIQKRLYCLLGLLVVASLSISLLYATEDSGVTTFEYLFPVPFQISRVNVLHPIAWLLIFSISVAVIVLQFPRQGPLIAASFAGLALVQGLWTSHSFGPRVVNIVSPVAHHLFCGVPALDFTCAIGHVTTIAEYYRMNDYAQVARQIGRPKSEYFVVSLGIDPMIAVFNGFKALDGYADIYPLEYKRRFRNIIAGELDDNPAAKAEFDKWGSRVYLYFKGRPEGEIRIDFCAARGMGAEYVISPFRLRDSELLKLVADVEGLRAYAINTKLCENGLPRPRVQIQ